VSEMKYISGLYAKRKSATQPDFVICNGSINKQQMQQTLDQMDGEWVNFQFLTPYNEDPAKPDKLVVKKNDWKPDAPKQAPSKPAEDLEDIPF
jgi:hypothetical protein